MNKLCVCSLVTAAAFAAVAAIDDIEFPNADSSGDLASTAAWGGVLPTDLRPMITAPGTYYISQDVTLPGLRFFNFPNGEAVMDLSESQSYVKIDKHMHFAAEHTVRFKGGTYDFQAKCGVEENGWSDDVKRAHDVVLELDGCVFTNMNTATTDYYGAAGRNTWRLKNNSVMHFSSANGPHLYFGYQDRGTNRFEILSGSRFSGYGFQFPWKAPTTRGSKILVSGANSRFEASSGAHIGATGFDILVEEGASLQFKDYWYLQGIDNTVRVKGEGATMTLATCYVQPEDGQSSTKGNRVMALDGATINMGIVEFSKYNEDIGFIASNATLNVTGNNSRFVPSTVNDTVTNCFLKAVGEQGVLNVASTGFALRGQCSFVEVTDGARGQVGSGYWYLDGTGNVVRATGPASSLSVSSPYIKGKSNGFEALDGATVTISAARFGNTSDETSTISDTQFVVSNATMNVASIERMGGTVEGYTIALKGTTPLMTSTSSIWFGGNLVVDYTLPLEGYPEGHIPLQMNAWCSGDGTAAARISNYEEVRNYMMSHGIAKKQWKLLRHTNGIANTTTESFGRNLPEGCTISAASGIWTLTVRVPLSTVITIR